MFVQFVIVAVLLTPLPSRFERDTDNPAVKDFTDRAERYWSLHKKIESAAPPMDKKKEPDPAVIIQRERAIADGLRAARKGAAEGEVFTPAVQKYFVDAINQELTSSVKGKTAREMILGEGNPKSKEEGKPVRVDLLVNAKYPPNAPLSTVPPSVLLKLPKLPQGLEYRFVGRHLILYDSKANLIVDILRNAVR